jgi:hypothetical protein
MMELRQFLTLESISLAFILFGWISQAYMAYGKRSTRTSKTSLVLLLLGFIGFGIALFLETRSFTPPVLLAGGIVLVVWMVYVRRR